MQTDLDAVLFNGQANEPGISIISAGSIRGGIRPLSSPCLIRRQVREGPVVRIYVGEHLVKASVCRVFFVCSESSTDLRIGK
jgi:hypothetical protein